jgi:uncharacterized protein YggE
MTVTLGDPMGPADDAGGLPSAVVGIPVVSVRGETFVEVEPEIVTLLVAVNGRAKSRRELIEALSARHEECLALVRSYADAIEKIQTSRLSVAPEPRSGRPEKTWLYRGSVRTRLTVRDFSVLGDLVSRLADLELATVDGPWWQLRPDSPVYRQAAAAAAREAVTRAREYAEAIGGQLTGLLELADIGLSIEGREPAMRAVAGRLARRGTAPQDEPSAIDLEPETQIVHAAVQARFTIPPPASLDPCPAASSGRHAAAVTATPPEPG